MINKHPDKVTYWKAGGIDYMGQPSWDSPVTIDCRWEDEQRLYLTSDGREARGRSSIYCNFGGLDIGDMVAMGVSSEATPPTGSYEVKSPRVIKNLRGTRIEHRYIV